MQLAIQLLGNSDISIAPIPNRQVRHMARLHDGKTSSLAPRHVIDLWIHRQGCDGILSIIGESEQKTGRRGVLPVVL